MNYSNITIAQLQSIAVVWFLCLNLRVFPQLIKLDYHYFFGKLGTCLMQKSGFAGPFRNTQFTTFYIFYSQNQRSLRMVNKFVSFFSLKFCLGTFPVITLENN